MLVSRVFGLIDLLRLSKSIRRIYVVLKYVVIVELLLIGIIMCFMLSDVVLPYIVEPRGSSRIIVFDAEDLVNDVYDDDTIVLKNFTLMDIFSLPKIDAELIIIVAHGFNYSNGFALGTSEKPSIIYPFIHPLYVLDKAVVQGKTLDGETRIGVTKEIIDYIPGEINSSIIIITCSYDSTREFIEKLAAKTRGFIAYYNGSLQKELVSKYVKEITMLWGKKELIEWLSRNNFIIYVDGKENALF